jgi:DNA-binding Xre family transcriptional regulator
MIALKNYIALKCTDQSYKKEFDSYCSVCRTTVSLLERMLSCGMSREELASKAGVSIAELTALEEADACSFEAVSKLCTAMDMPIPKSCRKGK